MSNTRTLLKRLVGCICIALCFSVIVFGCIIFIFKVTSNTGISRVPFIVAFILTLSLLVACNLLYLVNPALWNAIEDAKENSDDRILLRLLPNVKFLVDMCEFVGTFRSSSTQ